jgi:hypothetical protein
MADLSPRAAPATGPREPENDRKRGLYGKYFVQRLDPATARQDEILFLRRRYVDADNIIRDEMALPPPKHEQCRYFVLDLDHDRHARAALWGYLSSCAAEYPALAADLRKMLDGSPAPASPPPEPAEERSGTRDECPHGKERGVPGPHLFLPEVNDVVDAVPTGFMVCRWCRVRLPAPPAPVLPRPEEPALREALGKVNAIRNSIIGLQKINWSEHIYPLVAVLNEAGFVGMPYPEARENYGTMLERTLAAEARATRAEGALRGLNAAVENLIDAQGFDHEDGCPEDDTCDCPVAVQLNEAGSTAREVITDANDRARALAGEAQKATAP